LTRLSDWIVITRSAVFQFRSSHRNGDEKLQENCKAELDDSFIPRSKDVPYPQDAATQQTCNCTIVAVGWAFIGLK
jgi:hypothetical protein